MADYDMNNPTEEKKPFYKTPLGIILIVVAVLILCCCLGIVIAFATGASVFDEILNNPDIQKAIEDIQLTVEADQ